MLQRPPPPPPECNIGPMLHGYYMSGVTFAGSEIAMKIMAWMYGAIHCYNVTPLCRDVM